VSIPRQNAEPFHFFHYIMPVLLAATVVPSFAYQQAAVHARMEEAVTTQGEPVLLDLELENLGTSDITVDLGADRESNIQLSMISPSGKIARKSSAARREGIRFLGTVQLAPGEQYLNQIVLNRWFSFGEIGTYKLEVKLINNEPLTSDTLYLQLQVNPANPNELGIACTALGSRMRDSKSAEESLAAATALSYVHDPVVIPIWESVLRRPDFERFAISGLAQVGNSEAVAVLLRALKDSNADTRAAITSALQAIAQTTTDQSVRSNIETGLAHP